MKMRAMAAALLFSALGVASGQSADELVAKNLAARGGAGKLRAIESMRIGGTIFFGEEKSPITVRARRPSQIREEFTVGGTGMVRAYDGSTAWQAKTTKSGERNVETLSGGEADNIREEAENAIEGPLLDYAKKGSKLEALGRDAWGGKPVYKLKVTTHLGTVIVQFLEASTYLEVHEEIERTVNGKLMVIVEDVGDYRDVDGIKFAHRFVSGLKDNPNASTFQVDAMELNVPVDASIFALTK